MNPLFQGLLPYDRIWAITPDWKKRFDALSPQLYQALREDPIKFKERSLTGADISEQAIALGLLNYDLRSVGRSKRAKGKTKKRRADGGDPDDFGDDEGDIEEVIPPAEIEEEGDGTINEDDDDYLDDDDDDTLASCDDDDAPYDIVNGVALLSISGPMTKKPTSAMWLFGGTSTLLFRRKLAHAQNNPRVGAILIDFDTPGGTVAGTADLADHIVRVNAVKPVEGFVPDLCASAGFWAISGCRKITVGRAAQMPCMGVYMVVEDFSQMYTTAGVTVHVIKAGQFKGAGEEGTNVTPEQIADFQREVDGLNDEFRYSVQTGRKLTNAQVSAINTGQVWKGQDLLRLGVADAVDTYESVLSRLASEVITTGRISYNNAIPSASRGRASRAGKRGRQAGATIPILPPDAEYPKTGDFGTAVVGSALERIEAERLQLAEAVIGNSAQADSLPSTIEARSDNAGTGEPVAEDTENREPAENSETVVNPAETTITDTPPEGAGNTEEDAGSGVSEENMGDTTNNANNANSPAIDPALAAALQASGITSLAQLTSLVALASDGKKARGRIIGNIANYTTRIQGAETTDPESNAQAPNFEEIYGNLPFDNLVAIENNQRKTYEAMMKHKGQIDNPADNPAGARMTQGNGNAGISPAIVGALNAQAEKSKDNPTGLGLAMVDPDKIAEKMNAERDARGKARNGFGK